MDVNELTNVDLKVWEKMALTLLPKLLLALVLAAFGYGLIRLLMRISARMMARSKLDTSLQGFLLRVIKIVAYIVLIITVLSALDISTTGLIAGFSAAAAAVALALKDSLSNVAAGIILLFTHPFETGDFIAVNGEKGTVKRVDVIHTTLLTLDNRRVILPNSLISASQVVNFSEEPFRRIDLAFSVSYDNDIERVKETVLQAVSAHPQTLFEPAEPIVRVDEYADSAVTVIAWVWCRTEDYVSVRFDLIEQVRAAFDQKGISIPYPQLDVHVHGPEKTQEADHGDNPAGN